MTIQKHDDAQPRPPVKQAPPSTLSTHGLIVLVTGQLLTQLDFSIVNVALDRIGDSLGADATGLVLVVACYGISFATLLGASGRLGDRYGRKRLFLIGSVGFCIASMLCGLATSLAAMLAGRLFQGAFGALLMPQILATIHATLQGARHSRAVGIYTAVAGLSVVVGQVLGGWLVSANLFGLGWRLGFFVNLPVCVLVLGFGAFLIPETRGDGTSEADTGGMMLFGLFLLCLLLPASLGNDWPIMRWLVVALLPLGFVLLRVEARCEAGGGKPLLPPSLFHAPMVLTGFFAEAAVTFCYAGYLFVTALCLQSEVGFSPLRSGDSFCGLGAMFFLGSLTSKPLGERLGNHRAFMFGTGLTVAGIIATAWAIRAFGPSLGVIHIIAASGLVGFGNAFMLTSAYRIALSHVERHHAGEASVALATVQQGCFALGTAFAGAVYSGLLPSGYMEAFAGAAFSLCVLLMVVGCLIARQKSPPTEPSLRDLS
ncbi:MAG: MFS transporter [Rhodospirillaceae bacterium]|nr:MFS transporter [Rhodospirillaceae bacterium]